MFEVGIDCSQDSLIYENTPDTITVSFYKCNPQVSPYAEGCLMKKVSKKGLAACDDVESLSMMIDNYQLDSWAPLVLPEWIKIETDGSNALFMDQIVLQRYQEIYALWGKHKEGPNPVKTWGSSDSGSG